ncbi:unnamed protein product [Acanthoscelides obtectus]|uniref:Molybdopterin synthase sulfur carrier subunit n=1 Tax=Acanthoscelides obtectus TaxID=200917 RepID=A0A9P0KMF7_ACAOB|nr:unnamed protein product [Acanthoscelides obtectus]CAK1667600.1 Molybdopterin synthase sulfur carrier subunit [Acanthoscelides obtectus]
MPVTVNILFFAQARELAGKSEAEFTIETPIAYSDLVKRIVDEFSLTELQDHLILALNSDWVWDQEILNLKPADEIAVIPPLSGG